MDQKQSFEFTYSAPNQEEIRRIRQKYLPKEEDKLEQLRRLDQSVSRKGVVCSLVTGILGTLIMGIGMCCCLVWAEWLFFPGILIGLIGIAGIIAAYPLYSHITKKERIRVAPEILRLTDELMHDSH